MEDTAQRERKVTVLEGTWMLMDLLGEGGMGTVYRAQDLKLGRTVAVKLISPKWRANVELLGRFDREARTMARLDHPNLLPVYAVGQHEGLPFLVTKLLEGRSLDRLLAERGALAPEAVLPLARQICAGLAFLHERGAVHRDLKPENIFVGDDGHVTLLDFGLVRNTAESSGTQSGFAMGTPGYMAPEQIHGKSDLDQRADLYALGVVLFELLTGEPPWRAESHFKLMVMHTDEPVPDASARRPNVPKALAQVVARLMAKAPAARFGSAAETLAALEAAAGAPVSAAAAAAAPGARGDPPRRLVLWGAGALALGGALAVSLLFPGARAPEDPPGPGLSPAPAYAAAAAARAPVPAPVPEPEPGDKVAPELAPAPDPAAGAPQPPPARPDPQRSASAVEPAPEPPGRSPGRSRPARAPRASAAAPAAPGKLFVDVRGADGARSWGHLTVDGVARGSTQVPVQLSAGKHSVVVTSREGVRAFAGEVLIKPGEDLVQAVRLP